MDLEKLVYLFLIGSLVCEVFHFQEGPLLILEALIKLLYRMRIFKEVKPWFFGYSMICMIFFLECVIGSSKHSFVIDVLNNLVLNKVKTSLDCYFVSYKILKPTYWPILFDHHLQRCLAVDTIFIWLDQQFGQLPLQLVWISTRSYKQRNEIKIRIAFDEVHKVVTTLICPLK